MSEYSSLYDIVVPKDHLLRRINDLVVFSFVYKELVGKYCLTNGRGAESPIRMFKHLLLKAIFDISDVDVVERSRYDMSFKTPRDVKLFGAQISHLKSSECISDDFLANT